MSEQSQLENQNPEMAWLSPCGRYGVRANQTFRLYTTAEGEPHVQRLANFAARIVGQRVVDDGSGQPRRHYLIEGTLHDGRALPLAAVPVSRFAAMTWPAEVWSFGPKIAAGGSAREHLRAAIEEFSGKDVPCRTLYAHLGWRRTPAGWAYIHAGGAVGDPQAQVAADESLERYALPPEEGDVAAALRASLSFLSIGASEAVVPLWAAVWRAPLAEWLPAPLLLWVQGETGAFRTSTAALALSHFGGPFDAGSVPASWLDTENRLEQKAFLAKDTLLLIDDFCPERNAGLRQGMERRASRIIRGAGNRQGRGRMVGAHTPVSAYFPRGVLVATAECLPSLALSAIARLFVVPLDPGAIRADLLTALQAQAGLLPHAMRAYLQWLIPQAPTLSERLQTRFRELRARAVLDGHPRLSEAVAHLFIGIEQGLRFALECGALAPDRVEELTAEGWRTLTELAGRQLSDIGVERASRLFVAIINEGLLAGHFWLADRKTGEPAAGVWGPLKLGWVDGQGIYLMPTVAYRYVAEQLRSQGGMPASENMLQQMLLHDGYLIARPEGPAPRARPAIRCDGSVVRVWWLRRRISASNPLPSEVHPALAVETVRRPAVLPLASCDSFSPDLL